MSQTNIINLHIGQNLSTNAQIIPPIIKGGAFIVYFMHNGTDGTEYAATNTKEKVELALDKLPDLLSEIKKSKLKKFKSYQELGDKLATKNIVQIFLISRSESVEKNSIVFYFVRDGGDENDAKIFKSIESKNKIAINVNRPSAMGSIFSHWASDSINPKLKTMSSFGHINYWCKPGSIARSCAKASNESTVVSALGKIISHIIVEKAKNRGLNKIHLLSIGLVVIGLAGLLGCSIAIGPAACMKLALTKSKDAFNLLYQYIPSVGTLRQAIVKSSKSIWSDIMVPIYNSIIVPLTQKVIWPIGLYIFQEFDGSVISVLTVLIKLTGLKIAAKVLLAIVNTMARTFISGHVSSCSIITKLIFNIGNKWKDTTVDGIGFMNILLCLVCYMCGGPWLLALNISREVIAESMKSLLDIDPNKTPKKTPTGWFQSFKQSLVETLYLPIEIINNVMYILYALPFYVMEYYIIRSKDKNMSYLLSMSEAIRVADLTIEYAKSHNVGYEEALGESNDHAHLADDDEEYNLCQLYP